MPPVTSVAPDAASHVGASDALAGAAYLLRGACLVDGQGHIVAADAQVHDLLQAARGGGVELPCPVADLVGADHAAVLVEQLFQGDRAGGCFETQLRRGTGPAQPIVVRLRVLEGSGGRLGLLLVEEPSAEPAETLDALTGLPDRRSIARRIESWRRADRAIPFALLFVDLDNFKQLNDRHGHAVGDRALVQMAQRMRHCVREDDLIARYGGDEFVILLKDVAALDDAQPAIDRLQRCAATPIDMGEIQPHITLSIGAALAGSAATSIEALVDLADRDMYAHKRRLPR